MRAVPAQLFCVWALEGTNLRYGDQLGGSSEGAVVFGFECDGLDYVERDGLPFPTGKDGADVANTRILAVGLRKTQSRRFHYFLNLCSGP